jgi:hypothetical protein
LENITNTRNSASKITNDLKYVKIEPSSTGIINENASNQSELISDLTSANSSNNVLDKNLTDDSQENDAIRKRRLQHFESSNQ